MVNRIVLVGRLVADPEERYSNDGVAISKFRMAVDRRSRGRNNDEPDADFFNVVCFRQSAEFANKYLRRGYLVAVDGRLQMDQYTDRDGNPRTWVEVLADSVQNLTPRSESERMDSGDRAGSDRGGSDRGGDRGGRGGGRWDHASDEFDRDDFGERGGERGGGERSGGGERGGRGRAEAPERGGDERGGEERGSRSRSFNGPARDDGPARGDGPSRGEPANDPWAGGGGDNFDADDDDPFAEE